MTIAEAKEEIRRALMAYHRKDETGCYVYPVSQQRPILLMGPPGIGKSAVMEQVARECGVGLVAYTMTHHTRQSAIGLPRIVEREYEGETMVLTEYTLSEIIASIYACMKRTGLTEGILFIDEINCVSETLTPIMLSLLQNKRFGTHRVPNGWMIAAAGNPPAYNRSAREFDIVTMDRVRRLDIEPDLDVWLDYAAGQGVHPSIISYLQLHPEHFYEAVSSSGEKHFVTARGWEDLSALLCAYEALSIAPGDDQAMQFLGEDKIAREFAAYYRIFVKYGHDYQITALLDGALSDDAYRTCLHMAAEGSFDERFTVVGLITGVLAHSLRVEDDAYRTYRLLASQEDRLKRAWQAGESAEDAAEKIEEALQIRIRQESASPEDIRVSKAAASMLRKLGEQLRLSHVTKMEEAVLLYQEETQRLLAHAQDCAELTGRRIDRAFAFCEVSFGADREMLLLITGLSRSPLMMRHVNEHGSESFLQWSEKMGLGM